MRTFPAVGEGRYRKHKYSLVDPPRQVSFSMEFKSPIMPYAVQKYCANIIIMNLDSIF